MACGSLDAAGTNRLTEMELQRSLRQKTQQEVPSGSEEIMVYQPTTGWGTLPHQYCVSCDWSAAGIGGRSSFKCSSAPFDMPSNKETGSMCSEVGPPIPGSEVGRLIQSVPRLHPYVAGTGSSILPVTLRGMERLRNASLIHIAGNPIMSDLPAVLL